MFNSKLFELVKLHRSTDLELNNDAKLLRDGKTIDFTQYGNIEHDLALCHTNDMVDVINKKWNDHYAKTQKKQLAVNGFDGAKYIIYEGLKIMAYKTHPEQVFTNSEELEIKTWTDNTLTLVNDEKKIIDIDIKYTTIFKPAFAMTVHKSQGSTFTRPYSIYEYKTMKHRMLYVAITRANIKKTCQIL
jgi:hypothetical protein